MYLFFFKHKIAQNFKSLLVIQFVCITKIKISKLLTYLLYTFVHRILQLRDHE